ncbi:MAG: helix-hairpin-helix domain-containing protein [Maribacter sp.]|uniref:ComEA family DNA-binding protein n=1 Tax=Maribacter sp. TaxID=1897614 RepID=UPI003297E9CE
MKNFKSHFKFNKQERSGIFFLLLIIVVLQVGSFVFRSLQTEPSVNSFSADEKMQAKIKVLKEEALAKESLKIFPFNPNFITDFKGYSLGMSVAEIDRLQSFRSKDRYVNSPKEFQRVTLVSDSLLKAIAPYFKFPEWTKSKPYSASVIQESKSAKSIFEVKDLNSATAEELRSINGIGEKLSARIIKFRDRLGGFLVDEQLADVYGLDSEVVQRTLKRFKVLKTPQIEKINVNTASVEMLTKLIYLQRDVAVSIVSYRNSKGSIESFEELAKIENFPAEKIHRIALYLSL